MREQCSHRCVPSSTPCALCAAEADGRRQVIDELASVVEDHYREGRTLEVRIYRKHQMALPCPTPRIVFDVDNRAGLGTLEISHAAAEFLEEVTRVVIIDGDKEREEQKR